jgi:hypothetical protein
MKLALFKHLSLSKYTGFVRACFHGDRSSSSASSNSDISDNGKTVHIRERKEPETRKSSVARFNAQVQTDSDPNVPKSTPAQNFVGPLQRQDEEEYSDSGRPARCIPVVERRRRRGSSNQTSKQGQSSNDQTAQPASSS